MKLKQLPIMKLYDKGLLNLSDYVSTYLPELKDTDKQNITINELLYHQSGLQSTLLFYKKAIDEEKLENGYRREFRQWPVRYR